LRCVATMTEFRWGPVTPSAGLRAEEWVLTGLNQAFLWSHEADPSPLLVTDLSASGEGLHLVSEPV
jgi:hypothetical protein